MFGLSIVRILAGLAILFFGLMTFSKNKTSQVNKYFLILTTTIFIWLMFFSFASFLDGNDAKLTFFKFGYVGIICIPLFFLMFVVSFLFIKVKNALRFAMYGMCFLFLGLLIAKNGLLIGVYEYSWGYYPNVNRLTHPLFLLYFFSLFTAGFILLILKGRKEDNFVQLAKIRYVFAGSLLASFASIDFVANYNINVFPLGFLFMFQLPITFSYAIVRYRLMNISLAITRTSAFVLVYSGVLGIPFAMAFGYRDLLVKMFGNFWWVTPLMSSTILASLGPYIYLYIQKKAEDKLLEEQRAYQSTLRKASLGMGQIKDLRRLLTLIVHVVTKAVKINHCKIFLYHDDSNQFILKAVKNKKYNEIKINSLGSNSVLIKRLYNSKEPVVYQEIIQKKVDFTLDEELDRLEQIMKNLDAEVIVPSFIEQKLISFIVLGEKRSKKSYTQDDLVVFSILASQSALAIENAMFYEDTKRTHEQLFKAEKMATIGTMADGLSHQINNRLHAMGFIAGDAIDTLKRFKGKDVPKDTQKLLESMKDALVRIEDNVKRGGEIVQGLLTYTRKGEEGFSPVNLNKLLDSSIEMASYKIKTKQIKFERNFNGELPQIKGNFTQLQEVFFNIIDNSYDAIMQRKEELKEAGFHGEIHFEAHLDENGKLAITINDNGMGVKEDNKRKIFTPFFTTKLSSKKGTGLGMYVIKQIIEENHRGKVEFSSVYRRGSCTKILLPIYGPKANKS